MIRSCSTRARSLRQLMVVVSLFVGANLFAAEPDLTQAAVCRLGEANDTSWSHGVYATTFSPDEKLAAVRSSDQVIRIWDIQSGKKVRELPEFEEGRIRDFVFSHDSRFLITAVDSELPAVKTLWSVATGTAVESARLRSTYLVRRSKNAGDILHVSQHSVQQRSVTQPLELTDKAIAFTNLGTKAEPIAVSPDNERLIIGRSISQRFPSGRANIANATHKYLLDIVALDGRNLVPLGAFENSVSACDWSPRGADIAIACRDEKKVYFRNLTKSNVKIARGGHSGVIQDLKFSPDGRHLASVAVDGKLRIWEMQTRNTIVEVDEGSDRRLVSVAFSPDGRYLATGSAGKSDNSAMVWDWNRLLLTMVTSANIESPWDHLTSRDPQVAYPAMKQMVQSPASTLRELFKKFGSDSGNLTREEIAQLIERLSHPSYATRVTAHETLSQVRVTAATQLKEVLDRGTAPVETEIRLRKLLASAGQTGEFDEEQTRQLLRGVYVLELIGSREAQDLLRSIAERHPFDKIRASAAVSAAQLAKRLGPVEVQ